MANLLTNLTAQTTATATGSWATVTGMTDTVSVGATGNLVFLIFNSSPIEPGDYSTLFRFTRGGSPIGPVMGPGGSDSTNECAGGLLMYVDTGVSGSQTYAVQHITNGGSGQAQSTERDRSFQIIEVMSADANLLVNQSGTDSYTFPGTYSNITGLSDTQSVAGTGSILLFIAGVPITEASSVSADMRFADGGTREGPEMTFGHQSTTQGVDGCMTWVKTGISGSHTFSIQGQTRSGTATKDTGRNATFQVVEFTDKCNILVNVSNLTAASSSGSYATIDNLSGSGSPASNSVVLMLANVPITLSGTDMTPYAMFSDDGTEEGPEIPMGFGDATDLWGHSAMAWAKTGISGSHTFAIEWITGSGTTTRDTSRTGSFQVLELETQTYKLEGITKNNAGTILGSCECYLIKIVSGVHSFIDYVLSNASTGAYSFTGISDNDAEYLVVAWKDDTPHVFDATDYVLTPVVE